jgi:hypothetical protein
VGVTLGALGVCLFSGLGASALSAPPPAVVSAPLPSLVFVGSSVPIAGSARGAPKDALAVLQTRTGNTWHAVARTKLRGTRRWAGERSRTRRHVWST